MMKLVTEIVFGAVLILVTIFVYKCYLKYWSYFRDIGINYVRGMPLLGTHYKAIIGQYSLATSIQDVYAKYPNDQIVGMYDVLGKPIFLITDPKLFHSLSTKQFDHFTNHRFLVNEESDLLGKCILFQRGSRWKEMRATISTYFASKHLKLSHNIIVERVEKMKDHIQTLVDDNNIYEFDMENVFNRLTIDIMGACIYGLNSNAVIDSNDVFLTEVLKASRFTGRSGLKAFLYGSIPSLMNFLKINILEENNTNYFRDLVRNNVQTIGFNSNEKIDFIKLFLHTAAKKLERNLSYLKQKELTEDDIVAQCVILTLPSFLSISSCVCSVLHEIALNPQIQSKLYHEVSSLKLELEGKPISYKLLNKMKYLDIIVAEALRRWAPIPLTDRIVTKPIQITTANNTTKVTLQIGDVFWYPINSVHLDARYFSNPELFNPDRFSPDCISEMQNKAYTPFGNGPRNCIGKSFGLMAIKTILFYMVNEFYWEKGPKTQIPLYPKSVPSILLPSQGKWIQIKSRHLLQ